MNESKELTIEAKIENIDKVICFINAMLQDHGCTFDEMQRIDLAMEEMLVNISYYAYPGETGEANVAISFPDEGVVQLDIRDRGIPYDPTKREEPDVTIPLRQRKKGGLGIYMTKKIMDGMYYEYRDGVNHTILKKAFSKKDNELN